VLITADPRTSHRAFEAMRIAVGVAAGDNAVTLVLGGAGVHLLDGDVDPLVDGEDIEKFRTTLGQLGVPFHVEAAAVPDAADWNAGGHPVVRVGPGEVAALVRAARRLIVF
jgi:hypothetical protein